MFADSLLIVLNGVFSMEVKVSLADVLVVSFILIYSLNERSDSYGQPVLR